MGRTRLQNNTNPRDMPAFVCRQSPCFTFEPSSSRVELQETEDMYRICVLAPGVRLIDLVVTTMDDVLTIKGETGSRGVHRQLRLPQDAASESAKATHEDGILTIDVPKRTPTPPRNIEITAGPQPEVAITSSDEPTAVAPALALAAMGFTDAELVETALDKYSGDVDAASAALAALDGEWGAALDDLEEMGFGDRHANSKALLAHDGSVKLAVKALVAHA